MIIGINGKIGSGKDTVGKIIQYLTYPVNVDIQTYLEKEVNGQFEIKPNVRTIPNFEIKKFAGKLKQIASLLTGIDVEKFEDQDFKMTNLGPEWARPFYDKKSNVHYETITVRKFLQLLGTECMRMGLHVNTWVNALFADYKPQPNKEVAEFLAAEGLPQSMNAGEQNHPNWIITDMRFPNEMEAVELREGVTIKVVRPGTAVGTHPSETALDDAYFDHVISNDGTIEDLVEKVRQVLTIERII
jgi:hypothetical protein